MSTMRFPAGWDEGRVQRVLAHYLNLTQSEEEAVAEDENVFKSEDRAVVEVPVELMPVIRALITQYAYTTTPARL